jgi:hypothetical protein
MPPDEMKQLLKNFREKVRNRFTIFFFLSPLSPAAGCLNNRCERMLMDNYLLPEPN